MKNTGTDTLTLSRDVEAIVIPAGNKVVLPEGKIVYLVQELGGNYTVGSDAGLVRIDGKDADALGFEVKVSAASSEPGQASDTLEEEKIWEEMKQCYDPEIPVNIVDLGLIYDCEVSAHEEGGHRVQVKMTLTAPGCGMGQVLADDVKNRIDNLPGVAETQVEIVWDPQWNQSMMSEAARLQLGLM